MYKYQYQFVLLEEAGSYMYIIVVFLLTNQSLAHIPIEVTQTVYKYMHLYISAVN